MLAASAPVMVITRRRMRVSCTASVFGAILRRGSEPFTNGLPRGFLAGASFAVITQNLLVTRHKPPQDGERFRGDRAGVIRADFAL